MAHGMDPEEQERWRRVEELFLGAVDRPAGPDRDRWLRDACGGDVGLEEDVRALIASDAAADTVVRGAVADAAGALESSASSRAEPPPFRSPAPARIGKYEILEQLGEGGFGVVYLARDPLLERRVAIKTTTTDDPELQERFLREGRIAVRLQHPNVTTVHDLGIEGNRLYLVQELLDGCDLRDLMKAEEGLDLEDKLEMLEGIARALVYAHASGVLHRDVKPANVRILEDGRVKLMDFGIAKLVDRESQITRSGVALGTVGYLAPEQLAGKPLDRRADIFSFGVLAYELLGGRTPFPGSTFSEISYKLLYEDPPELHRVWPPCPDRDLSRLVGACLSREVEERPASFELVLRDLEAIRGRLAGRTGSTTRAPETGDGATLELPRRIASGRRAGSRRLAAALVLALGVAAAAFLLSRPDDPGPTPPGSGSLTRASVEAGSPPAALGERQPPAAVPVEQPVAEDRSDTATTATDPSDGTSAPFAVPPDPVLPPARSAPVEERLDPGRTDPVGPGSNGPADRRRGGASDAVPADGGADATPPAASEPLPPPPAEVGTTKEPASPGEPDLRSGSSPPPDTGRPAGPGERPTAPGVETTVPVPPVLQAGVDGTPSPAVLVGVEPEVPRRDLRRLREPVEIGVLVLVGVDGRPEQVRAEASVEPRLEGLLEASLEAARATRFEPPRAGGRPIRVWTPMVFRFER